MMLLGTGGRRWSAAAFDKPTLDLVPGVVLKGANIAPKAAHVSSGAPFRALFDEWDWDDWIKPQIDAIASVGGNAVRLIGDIQGVHDETFTQAYYDGRWGELIDYAWETHGMYTYPALSGVSQIANGSIAIEDVEDLLVAAADAMHERADRIVGLDLIQESVRRQVAGSYALVYGGDLTSAVRAVTDIPLTFSNSDAATEGATRFVTRLWRDVMRDWVDYWDIHVYCNPAPSMVHEAFWDQGETKPVLIGEFGRAASAGESSQSGMYQSIVDLSLFRHGRVHVAGAFAWAVFDQGTTSNAFGMFETNGTARTHLTDVFEDLPTV